MRTSARAHRWKSCECAIAAAHNAIPLFCADRAAGCCAGKWCCAARWHSTFLIGCSASGRWSMPHGCRHLRMLLSHRALPCGLLSTWYVVCGDQGCVATLTTHPLRAQLFWLLLGFGIIKLLRYLHYRAQGSVVVRMKVQRKIDVDALIR